MSDRPVASLHIIAVTPGPQGVTKSALVIQKLQANEMTARKRHNSIPTRSISIVFRYLCVTENASGDGKDDDEDRTFPIAKC